jgi:hypothetical protein
VSYSLHRSAERDLTDAFRMDLGEAFYSHGVFDHDPAVVERQKAAKRR